MTVQIFTTKQAYPTLSSHIIQVVSSPTHTLCKFPAPIPSHIHLQFRSLATYTYNLYINYPVIQPHQ